jgi:hypothetical protein
VQTLIQFSPTGITIPTQDKAKKAIIAKVISFPRELIVDQFSFAITATADDDTPQAMTSRDLMLGAEVNKFADKFMLISSAAWAPNVPPPIANIGTRVILGLRNITARLFTNNRMNPDDYLPTSEEIESIPSQLLQMQIEMQEMGAANGVPGAGGDIPPDQGGGPPMGIMEAQPDDAGIDPGDSQANIPGGF